MMEKQVLGIRLMLSKLFTAAVLSFAAGYSLQQFGEVALMLGMSVLGLPLLMVDGMFQFPTWMWYVIVIQWVLTLAVVVEAER